MDFDVSDLLAGAKSNQDSQAERVVFNGYKWDILDHKDKPTVAWVLPAPDYRPRAKHIRLLCSRGKLQADQAYQIGSTLVELAQEINPRLGPPPVFSRRLEGRSWKIFGDPIATVQLLDDGHIMLYSDSEITTQSALRIGSYLQHIALQDKK